MKIREAYTCPLELTHDLTKGKWKPIILWLLGKGPSSLAGLEKTSTPPTLKQEDGGEAKFCQPRQRKESYRQYVD